MIKKLIQTKKLFIMFCLLLGVALIPTAQAKAEGSDIKILLGETEIKPDEYYLVEYDAEEGIIGEGTEENHNLYFNSAENTLYLGGATDMIYYTQSEVGLTLPDDSNITIYTKPGFGEFYGSEVGIKCGSVKFVCDDKGYFRAKSIVAAGDVDFDAFSASLTDDDTVTLLTAKGDVKISSGSVYFTTNAGSKMWDVGGEIIFSDDTSITYPEGGYLGKDSNGDLDVYWVNPRSNEEELYDFQGAMVSFEAGENPVKIVELKEEAKPEPEATPEPEKEVKPAEKEEPAAPVVQPQVKDSVPKTGEANTFNWSLIVMVASGAAGLFMFSKKFKRQ